MGARVRCTKCTEALSEVRVYPKGYQRGVTNGKVKGIESKGDEYLNHYDTLTMMSFRACKDTPDKKCVIKIQDNRWFGSDGSVEFDGGDDLDSELSYMICSTKGGMIYISYSGHIRWFTK